MKPASEVVEIKAKALFKSAADEPGVWRCCFIYADGYSESVLIDAERHSLFDALRYAIDKVYELQIAKEGKGDNGRDPVPP